MKGLLKDMSIYALLPQATKFISIFMLPVLTSVLTVEDYAEYGLMISIVGVSEGIFSLGLRVHLSNSFFKHAHRYQYVWSRILALQFIVAIVLLIIIFPVFNILHAEFFSQYKSHELFVYSFLPQALFIPILNQANLQYQFSKKPNKVVALSLVKTLAIVALNLVFIFGLGIGYLGFLVSNFIVSLSIAIYLCLKREVNISFHFNYTWARKRLKVSIPLIPHYYSSYMLNAGDKLLLPFLGMDKVAFGAYILASQLANVGSQLQNAYSKAIVPHIMPLLSYKNSLGYTSTLIKHQLIFMCLGLVLLFLTVPLTRILINDGDFFTQQGDIITILLLLSFLFRPLYLNYAGPLWYQERTLWLGLLTSGIGLLSLVLNVLFFNGSILLPAFITLGSFFLLALGGNIVIHRGTKRLLIIVMLVVSVGCLIVAFSNIGSIITFLGLFILLTTGGLLVYKYFVCQE